VAANFVKAWKGALTEDVVSAEDAQGLIEQIPALMQQHPVQGENTDAIPAGVTRIEDMKAFKAALQISEPPKPLAQWNDLPTPNL